MRIEDVKTGMRVKYEHDGEVDYGVVKEVYRPPVSTCEEVWCDWESDGAYLLASPEHITPVEENTPKFKVGDKVVVVDTDGGLLSLGDIVTVSSVEKAADQADRYFYNFKEVPQGSGLFKRRLAPYTEQKKTAEEIAPMLWTAYKDVLNDEALTALRNVIEDVDNHEKLDFSDSDEVEESFEWSETSQGAGFWLNVRRGKYDKDVGAVSNPETELSCTVSASDTGSAATRNKYSREISPGIFVDVYDVLRAFNVTDPCLQHLVKKALAVGQRGHKGAEEDLKDIMASAKRALEMHKKWGEQNDKTCF